MGADQEQEIFLQKFDKALLLLSSFCDKNKASFSENVSFLLDKALDHLKKLENDCSAELKAKDSTHQALIQSKTVIAFLTDTLKVSKAPIIHPPIIVFSIKLVMQLSRNETRFQLLHSTCPEVFILIQQLKETTITENSEIKQTFLSLFSSLSKFKMGQDWLWTSGSLLFAVQSLADRTVFTRKTAQELLNSIFPSVDADKRQILLKNVFDPISQARKHSENPQIESDRLKPFFEVLESYIENCLTSNKPDSTGSHLSALDCEKILTELLSSAENEKLLSQTGSVLVAFFAKCASETINNAEISSWEDKTLKVIQLILRRGFIRPTLSVTSQSLFYWSHVKTTQTSLKAPLLHLMILPVLIDTEEAAKVYGPEYEKLYQFWREAAKDSKITLAISDMLESILKTNNELNELTSITLAGFRKSMDKLGKEFALKITRACLFLMGCLKSPDSRRTSQLYFTPQLAIHLTKSLCSFVDVYNIKWWESHETVCLPILFTKLVAYNASRDIQVTCAGLEGLKFCIQQFIHPDQALLLSHSPDSTMNDAADVLQLCSVSVHWEVRDSALEVILEMTRISQTKYPEFQQLLIRSNLLTAAMSAFNDMEAYVRASAIAVVAAATPVPLLWDHLVASGFDVIGSCYKILQQDNEALARRAAAKALTLVTQSGHFPLDADRSILYQTMSSAAISDLDWEVKLQALSFWRVIIDESLSNQGMMDGKFPEYSFSTNGSKKIVRLDSSEIRLRLQSSMALLGSCGCLHILLQLADDCDAPVRKEAVLLLRKLRDLLAEYGALDMAIWSPSNSQTSSPAQDSSPQVGSRLQPDHEMTPIDIDRVIEEILDLNDGNLVADIMAQTVKESQVRPDPAPVSSLSARDFVNKVNVMELESMLETTGLSSDLHVIDLDSLLDDLQDCIHSDPTRPRPDCY